MAEKIVQTAGREQLGEFAPMFAHLNDDVLFGEVWNEEAIDVKTKCIITVTSLMASGITDSSLSYHLQNIKETKDTVDFTQKKDAVYFSKRVNRSNDPGGIIPVYDFVDSLDYEVEPGDDP